MPVSAPRPHSGDSKPLQHIAIIMDGNGRWAQSHGLPRTAGHRKGAEALKELLGSIGNYPDVKHLTLYAFSSENWNRPEDEVKDLMGLLQHYLQREARTLHNHQIKLNVIGDLSKLSSGLQKNIRRTMEDTSGYKSLQLNMALSYGSRQELVHATRKIAQAVAQGQLQADAIDDSLIQQHLYTHDVPDPDLLIRTGGDQRISNFLLWQCAYTEFYFTPVLWPDFSAQELTKAIANYGERERRYGNVG
jgi:undecaprenyl diphosphate synthase